MYYLWWLVLLGVSLGIGLFLFIWAVRTDQFADQDRARFLPLRDDYAIPAANDRSGRIPEVYALLAVLGIGLSAMAAVFILTLTRVWG